jgi:hypothetical protein
MNRPDPMPVTPLGIDGDLFVFRDSSGRTVSLSSFALFHKPMMVKLFGGEAWLRRNFPGEYMVIPQRSGGCRSVPLGIDIKAAATFLAQECLAAEQAKAEPIARRRGLWDRLMDWIGSPILVEP